MNRYFIIATDAFACKCFTPLKGSCRKRQGSYNNGSDCLQTLHVLQGSYLTTGLLLNQPVPHRLKIHAWKNACGLFPQASYCTSDI
jgi:hypothetical protein